MANYVKSTNFTSKDSLPTGDPLKVVKGTEIDVEFNNIATAVTSKADSASPTFSGTPFAPTAAAGTNTTQIATTAFVTSADIAERTATATLTNKTLTTPKVDVINEATSDAGVTVDGVLLKDGSVDSSALGSGTPSASTVLLGDRTWGSAASSISVAAEYALFTSSGTWVCPASVTKVKATVVGGGGGANTFSGRGAQGGVAVGVYTVTPGTSYSVTVGVGGTLTIGTGNGGAGGTSSFASFASATGGMGQTFGSTTLPGVGTGGNISNTVNPSGAAAYDRVLGYPLVGRPHRQFVNGTANQSSQLAYSVTGGFEPGAGGGYWNDGDAGRGARGVNGVVLLEYVTVS
jgi:hypothetical protein